MQDLPLAGTETKFPAVSIAAALAELERSPELAEHISHLQAVLANEQRRREQFHQALDGSTKAEFINGKIVTHAPERQEHVSASAFAYKLLSDFAKHHESGAVHAERCLIRCDRNDYEPDVCFFRAAKAVAFSAGQLIFPPPDLIVEVISPSTESNDRGVKLLDYARHGVSEYWIVDADEKMIEQYVLPPDNNRYALHARLPEGATIASVVLAGFATPVAALFDVPENRPAQQALAD